jgi:hypothetical protein
MNLGKTLFTQLMELVPWANFLRIVGRYGGDSRMRSLSCTGITKRCRGCAPKRALRTLKKSPARIIREILITLIVEGYPGRTRNRVSLLLSYWPM